jgi:hypothetical protein
MQALYKLPTRAVRRMEVLALLEIQDLSHRETKSCSIMRPMTRIKIRTISMIMMKRTTRWTMK